MFSPMEQKTMLLKLKTRYDGYHFSEKSEDIYNPFSLIRAFMHQKITNYWFDRSTPTFLIRQMEHFNTNIMSLEEIKVPVDAFVQPTENMKTALPLLYQSGYVTIKDYDRESKEYSLYSQSRGTYRLYQRLNGTLYWIGR